MASAREDIHKPLSFDKTDYFFRKVPFALGAGLLGLVLLYSAPSGPNARAIYLLATMLICGGLGFAAFAFWRRKHPGQPTLLLSSTGIRYRIDKNLTLTIPWSEVAGVDAAEGTGMWHRQRDGARGMMPTRIPGSGRRIECSKSVWLLAFLAVLSATGMPGGAGAQTATAEPLELVRSFYVADFDQDAMPLSRRLETLRARAEEVSMQFGAPMAGLLHDWTLGPVDPDNPPGDGWQETVRVVESGRGKDRVTVVATFIAQSDGRDREEVRYLLLREGGRWVVDDIHYQAGGETLSALLEAGARGERN